MKVVYQLSSVHYGSVSTGISVAMIMVSYVLIIIIQNSITIRVEKDYYFNIPLVGLALLSSFYFLPICPRRALLLFMCFLGSTLLTMFLFRTRASSSLVE